MLNKDNLISLLLKTIIMFFILLFSFLFDHVGLINSGISIILSIYLLIKYRKSHLCTIIFLFILLCNYSFAISAYFVPNLYSSLDYSFAKNTDYLLTSSRCILLFMATLIIFSKKTVNNYKTEKYIDVKDNKNLLLVIVLLIASIAIWILFYDFNVGSRAGYSPIYEYSVILILFAYYYCGGDKKLKILVLFVAIFYTVFDFLGGQRSTGFQMLIISAIFFLYNKFSFWKIIILGIVAIFAANFIAVYRANGYEFNFNFVSMIFSSQFDNYLTDSTASYAYYTSNTFLLARDHYSFFERFSQFFDFIISQLIVGTKGKALTEIALSYHYHFYGGVLPIYIYYYLGYFGVFLIGILSSFYINIISKFNRVQNGFTSVFSIYITASTFRWYLYSPNQLIRGVFILAIVYLILRFIHVNVLGQNKRYVDFVDKVYY